MLLIAVHCCRRECGLTDSNVFRAAGMRRRISYPLAPMSDYSLFRRHIQDSAGMLYANDAAENQRVLVEFGSLAGFFPTFRTAHVRNADAFGFRIHTANECLDDLRLGSSGF